VPGVLFIDEVHMLDNGVLQLPQQVCARGSPWLSQLWWLQLVAVRARQVDVQERAVGGSVETASVTKVDVSGM